MARPNPRFDPISGSVSTPIAPRQPRPNPRYGNLQDVWVVIDGYTRNLFLEDKLQRDYDNIVSSGDIPIQDMPAQWSGTKYGWRLSTNRTTGQRYTDQETVNYLENLLRVIKIVNAQAAYVNDYYPRDKREQKNTSAIETVLDHIKTVIQQGGLVIGDIPKSLGGLAEEYNVKEVHGAEIFNAVVRAHQGSKIFEFLPQASAEQEETIIISNGVTEPTPEPVTVTTPEPVNESITDNMIIQQIDYFTIENGRAIGQITFTATQNFNPFWYNKTITNLIQFKDRNGVNILPTVKQNNLRFTATERTETIQYDEGMQDHIYSKVSSFVWTSATKPTPFSKQLEFEIREKEPVKPIASGFMAAGVAGAIAGLVLLGFIVDSKVGK